MWLVPVPYRNIMTALCCGEEVLLSEVNGEWAGPIPEPSEPRKGSKP